jgi:tRNA (guanine37-N1)-methyltransferase
MRVDIVTLFPEIFAGFLEASFVGRGIAGGQLSVRLRSPRDFGSGKHRSVDDTPYGGGSGMVMRVDVLVACMESLDADAPEAVKAHRVLLTPQGRPFVQARASALADRPAVMLVCGRYEGFDERVRAYVDEEVSLGDFVMTGGEVAAMAVVDACVRLLPGVLGNEDSTKEESYAAATGGLLEYPQYTRPAEFRGAAVPEILTRGHHAEIARWRREQSVARTGERRPDLLEKKP